MKYEVEITRISYATLTFGVEAGSEEEAKDLAMDMAYNTSFEKTMPSTKSTAATRPNSTMKNGRMSMERNMNIIESWWRHNGIWDREQASGILVENYDGETALYLESTDDWWESLTDIQKQQVYEDFFNEQ